MKIAPGENITTDELIFRVFNPQEGDSVRHLNPPNTHADLMQRQNDFFKEKLDTAQRFHLTIEKAQAFYDQWEANSKSLPTKSLWSTFRLPFKNCLFTFEQPLRIMWTDKEDNSRYSEQELIGVLITQGIERVLGEKYIGGEFTAFLVFNETPPDEETVMLSHQYIYFHIHETDSEIYPLIIRQVNHYPCQDKIKCYVEKDGFYKAWFKDYIQKYKEGHGPTPSSIAYTCPEVLARDSLIHTLIYIVNKIHDVTPIFKDAPTRDTRDNPRAELFGLPLGWPWTKGNLPKDNYTLQLDSYRYKYDPDTINYGSGTKHRFRYDVRKHPRIVGDKIIWVESHQRGAGKYIRKVYANRKKWFVPYVLFEPERLTRFRVIELIYIRVLHWIRHAKEKPPSLRG